MGSSWPFRKASTFPAPDSSPSIGSDGTIYVQAKGLYAVDPDGSVRWSAAGVFGYGDAILGADGTIYVAGLAPPGRWGIYALDSEGRRLGDYPKDEARLSTLQFHRPSPIIGLDGSIIVAVGNELVSHRRAQPDEWWLRRLSLAAGAR